MAVCGLDQKIKIMDTNTKKIIYDQDQNFEISSITFLKDKNGEKIVFTIDVIIPLFIFNLRICLNVWKMILSLT